ncbi:SdiA-regulated/phytase-like domain-containing protein [Rubripirellula reticaptiva]|nr:hypothetical protein [Rubripirellula reticaptiva]
MSENRMKAALTGVILILMPFLNSRSAAIEPIRLTEPLLTESSGLAFSNRRVKTVWTHNDSGGRPELFAFDSVGKRLARQPFAAIKQATDWEDIASFVDGDCPRLLIADCGDNDGNRASIQIYLLDEPDPSLQTSEVNLQTLRVTYPDGPRDCEAVAVDIRRRLIVLITKSVLPMSGVYTIPLPAREDQAKPQTIEVTATRIRTLPIPMVTAADFDPATGDLWVINYFQAFRFNRMDAALTHQLTALPIAMDLPKLRQIEAMAVDRDGAVWVTSEGNPALMQMIETPKP